MNDPINMVRRYNRHRDAPSCIGRRALPFKEQTVRLFPLLHFRRMQQWIQQFRTSSDEIQA